MKHKRLNRDTWGFSYYPYYQMRIDHELFHGMACLIRFTDGEENYWDTPKAGRIQVTGAGMTWLELVPDNAKRVITVMYFPDGTHDMQRKNYPACANEKYQPSVWYVDVIEGMEEDEYGIAVFIDKYLDVIFTPEGDVKIDDREELDAAFQSGELTKEQYDAALSEGDQIQKDYCGDIPKTDAWCAQVRQLVEDRIAQGEPVKPCKEVLEVRQKKEQAQNSVPQTLAELKEFAAVQHIPLEKLHMHLGEDYPAPKAFGIYQDGDDFVVYKNKADGSRAIRYRGKDEAHAVNEIYQKMREMGMVAKNAQNANDTNDFAVANRNKPARKSFINGLLIVSLIVMLFSIFWKEDKPKYERGYYRYHDDYYYSDGDDWYLYGGGIWSYVASDLVEAIVEDYDAYSVNIYETDIDPYVAPSKDSWDDDNDWNNDDWDDDDWYDDNDWDYDYDNDWDWDSDW